MHIRSMLETRTLHIDHFGRRMHHDSVAEGRGDSAHDGPQYMMGLRCMMGPSEHGKNVTALARLRLTNPPAFGNPFDRASTKKPRQNLDKTSTKPRQSLDRAHRALRFATSSAHAASQSQLVLAISTCPRNLNLSTSQATSTSPARRPHRSARCQPPDRSYPIARVVRSSPPHQPHHFHRCQRV